MSYSLRQLANIAAGQEEFEKTIRLMQEDLSVSRVLHGNDHSDTAQRKVNLARILRLHGRPAEATPLLQSATPVLQATTDLGNRNIYAVALKEQSYPLLERGAADRAEPLLREALAILSKNYPRAFSPAIPEIESMLGACLTAQGRYDEAEGLLKAAHETLKEQVGQARGVLLNHRLTRQTLGWLEALYQAWGKPDEAAAHRALLDAMQ